MKNIIRELRTSRSMTQDELSKVCGVTRQTINAVENDKYDPTLSLAFSLAKALETTVDILFSAVDTYGANKIDCIEKIQ